MNKKQVLLIKLIVGISLIFLLFFKVGIKNIALSLAHINPIYLIPVILIHFISFILTALNFYVLLVPINKKVKFYKVMVSSLIAWTGGMLAPGKLGEFSIVYLLKKDGVEYGEGLAISIIDKLVTFFTLTVISSFALFIFFSVEQAIRVIIICTLIFICIMIIVFAPFSRKLVRKYILRKYEKNFTGFAKTAKIYIKKGWWAVLVNMIFTIIKWVTIAFVMKLIFMSFGLIIPWWIVLLITSATTLISLIPVSISGLGIRESSATFLYSMISIQPVTVVSAYTVMMLINYAIVVWVSSFYMKEISREN